ncbi:diacylglycerol kinase family protein [Lapillicoccus sp.]|uniref:diacylglycerol/lipid kinase family protein n=1 Tax=Lapillicoccus sp. TaxID=1909287 RepID=UPI0032649174
MLDNRLLWIALAVLLVAVVVVVVAVRGRDVLEATGLQRRRRPHRDEFRPEGAEERPRVRYAGVVVNPTKFADLAAVQARVTAACASHGWGAPRWYTTTLADPGAGQARAAVADGVDVVCTLGGDGTVRAVAAALVGTETPLGLLGGGTGNLLGRNLDLPVDHLDRAVAVALTGQNARIDVGRLEVDSSGQQDRPNQHIFLVMAGLGFDAAIMSDAPEQLKARVGSAAYVVSGFRNFLGPQFRARIQVSGEPELSRRTRTVIIGNCGRLFGGLVLMPDAKIDDGLLDTMVLSPRGLVGWTAVAGHVMTRQRRGHSLIDRHSGSEVRVTTDEPQLVQLDGDLIGTARTLTATVDHLALVVRVAATGQPKSAAPQ